jgi:PAS domain S-box-containing protein
MPEADTLPPLDDFRLIADSAPVPMWVTALDRRRHFVNRAYVSFLGVSYAEAVDYDWRQRLHPDDAARVLRESAAGEASLEPFTLEGRYTDASGEYRWLRSVSQPRWSADGAHIGFVGVAYDITDARRAEHEAREREEVLQAFISQTTAGFAQVDLSGRLVLVNDRFCEIVGRSREATLGLTIADLTHPDDWPRNATMFDRAFDAGTPYTHEKRYLRGDGSEVWVNNSVSVIRGPDGTPFGVLAVVIDVTERRAAEERLRQAEERLRLALEGGRIGTWDWDLVTRRGTWSPRTQEIMGLARATDITPEERYRTIHPDDRERVMAEVARSIQDGSDFSTEYRIVTPGGEVRWIASRGVVTRNAEGRAIRTTGTVRDVTVRRTAQEELQSLNATLEARVAERTREREAAQEALRQAQKMEALGQLTGGVAHDFNNLLSPILGGLDLLRRGGLNHERAARLIDGALQSAERARLLVQRLLAFARRQPLQVRAVDLGALIGGLTDLLAATLGPQVRISLELAEALPPAVGDANQLEMALINLAVNARDAMPDGGALTITAERAVVDEGHRSGLAAGEYVRLSVVDTGEGMDAATLARAAEPFFSTKGVGKGTGLGLSMAHGLAAQLGGALTLSSQVGVGTNVELWLPIAAGCAQQPTHTAAPAGAMGEGRVLLVDDEPIVRATTATMLAELGYDVVEAECGADALALIDGGLTFDVLLTDHLMPRMTGTDLARTLRQRDPGLRVLIASGYAESAELAPEFPHLAKPFRPADLAEKLALLR